LGIVNQQNYTLVASKEDLASITMVEYLKNKKGFSTIDNYNESVILQSKQYKNVKLFVCNKSLLHLEDLDEITIWNSSDIQSYIFLSKHSSKSGIPTLTCHSAGNYADNPYGGNSREIALSYPHLQKQYLRRIANVKSAIPNYDIVIESTHHGPTSLKKPVLFVEIGSTEKQWTDTNAASIVCDCILNVIESDSKLCKKVGIALGGTHYPIKFNKLLLDSEFCLAAIATKYDLRSIDEDMLRQMIFKSIEKVTHVIIDQKGLGEEKDRIMCLIANTGLDILKV
jgi:D-aminoacyl-tRNA deacylase